MEFEISLDYTIEDLAAFWYGFIRKKAGKPLSLSDDPPKWARGLGCFFCGFFIVMGAVSVVNSLIQGRRMYMEEAGLLWNLFLTTPLGGLVEMAFGGWGLWVLRQAPAAYLLRPPYSRWVRNAWKKYQAGGPLYRCQFAGDGVWVHDSKSDHRYDYEFIEALWEDPERFYLVLSNRAGAYILSKARFTTGAPADLPAFWQARTGKPVLPATPDRRRGGGI